MADPTPDAGAHGQDDPRTEPSGKAALETKNDAVTRPSDGMAGTDDTDAPGGPDTPDDTDQPNGPNRPNGPGGTTPAGPDEDRPAENGPDASRGRTLTLGTGPIVAELSKSDGGFDARDTRPKPPATEAHTDADDADDAASAKPSEAPAPVPAPARTRASAPPSGRTADTGTDAGSVSAEGSGRSARSGPGARTAAESSETTRAIPSWALADEAAVESGRTMALRVTDLPGAGPVTPPGTTAPGTEAPHNKWADDPFVSADPSPGPAAPGTDRGSDGAQPPAAPLTLLAQLTNTPPPPPRPARTLLRRLKIWTPIVGLLALGVVGAQLLRPLPAPAVVVESSSATVGEGTFDMPWPAKGQAAVMVAGSGTIGTFGEQKPVPTASVAKIMTAYVLLREYPIKRDEQGPSITIDARTVEEGKAKDESRIEGLEVGQTFALQDMLKMLMIPSGNNVARMLARWNTKTDDETAFVQKMNEAAASLGMTNTTYTDPSGLDKGTVSTAVDQLKLADAVMKFETFRAVVAMPDADIPGVGRIYNNNQLTSAGLSVRGIKTGSNTPAGGTLSWASYKTVDGVDRLILGTMMDQHAPGADLNGADSLALVLKNSKKVIEAVRGALTTSTVVRSGQVLGYVDDGLGGRTPVTATKDMKVVGVPGQELTLTFRDKEIDLGAERKAATVVGELVVGSGKEAQRVPVALRSERPEPSYWTRLTRLG
ncbi:serine hydrolase [Streptomyces sp. NPDC046203]|uniref:D-alanyl-D-alanine carboxypeptidase family protein n=1 Tax=Streptomyces sp. NPDC046203 TaxID=3154602 RepID=UPI003400C541